MKTHPIIFSGPMVRALLEGRKTQTRRLAKRHHRMKNMLTGPWGKQVPGNLLWVRETWRRITPSVGTGYMGVDQRIAAIDYKATEGAKLQQRIIAPMGCKHGQDLPYTSGEFSGLVSKCLDN